MLLRLTFLLFAYFLMLPLLAQQQMIDSFKVELQKHLEHDSIHVRLLNDIAYSYRRTDPSQMLRYASRAAKISNEINHAYGEARAYRMYGAYFNMKSRHDSARFYHQKSLELFKKIGNAQEAAYSLGNIGVAFDQQGLYNEAIRAYEEAMVFFEADSNFMGMSISAHNIGTAFDRKGLNRKAIEYFFKEYEYSKRGDDREGMGYATDKIADMYLDRDSTEKALKYYKETLSIRKELGDELGTAISNSKLGSFFTEIGISEEAKKYFDEASEFFEKQDYPEWRAKNYVHIGQLHYRKGDFREALVFYEKALELLRQTGSDGEAARVLAKIARAHRQMNNYREAEAAVTALEKISKNIGSNKDLLNAYSERSYLDSAAGNYRGAFRNFQRFYNLEDSLRERSDFQKITFLQSLFEDEKTATENRALKAEHSRDILELAKRQYEIYGLAIGILLFVLLAVLLYINQQKERKARIVVTLKNEEIKQQQEEILAQSERLKQANEELTSTGEALQISMGQIQKKNEDITSSINYASRIQSAVLPFDERIRTFFPDFFVYFKPRDIVSGDFYWFQEKNNLGIFVAADCTGHGVPGAFMSMIGTAFLDQIVLDKGITNPGEILNELHQSVRKALKQESSDNRDGMDISIITVDKQAHKVWFAGAKNPLTAIIDNKTQLIKGDKHSIGGRVKAGTERTFLTHEITWQNQACFYLFSDGYQDQFGGPEDRKFTRRRLVNFLSENYERPFDEQNDALDREMRRWKKNRKQIDDILVLGVRLGEEVF